MLLANRGQAIHAAGTLSIDRYNGGERVQFRLCDVAPVAALA
jgi:single-stranded-DNA-specific exonuclease